jgi:hypothetical protein
MPASPATARSEPGGIVAELNPEARKVLDAVRAARAPSREDRERVFAALMASVAVTAVVPSVVAAKSGGLLGKLASNALWVKAAASVAVISVASVSTIAYVRHRGNATVAARPTVSVAAPSARVALPEVPVAPPAVSRVAAAAPSPVPSVERPAPAFAPARRAPDRPSAELALLRQARDARRAGQPERALELAREHEKNYPDSERWAERETLRVLALCDLGRVDAARRSAAPLQYWWSSPLRATLNASCVGK